jgi:type IV secretion system coupling TraD/TrwB family protein
VDWSRAVLTAGWSGLAFGYAVVAAPMLGGMIRARAPLAKLLLAPLLALPVTGLAASGIALASPLTQALGMASNGVAQLLFGTVLAASAGYFSGTRLAVAGSIATVHQRGALIVRSGARARSPDRTVGDLKLAGTVLALEDEVKHFKFIGTTGTGKSTAIHEVLRGALARGDRAVIADPEGGYLARFYQRSRGDVILNPFDSRSVKWDLFGEIRSPYDIDQLARALIPDEGGADRAWRGYARTFFSAVARQAHGAGVGNVGELYRLLMVATTAELRTLVAGTPAQPFLEEHNGRMFDSIRSVASSATAALEYIAAQDDRAERFSVRDWVSRGRQVPRSSSAGVLFIPYEAGQIAALRSPISAWMRLAIFEAMNTTEGDQRLWFVVDELDALGQIDGLKDALARLRKFGGRCILGFQSIAQVSSTYGQGDGHTIVENCGNTLILRCSGSEGGGTSRFASRLIGEREVLRTTASWSRRSSAWRSSSSRSEHFSTELALLPSEIEQLPDLRGFLKVASHPEWLQVSLQRESCGSAESGTAKAREEPRRGCAGAHEVGQERSFHWKSLHERANPARVADRDYEAQLFDE